MKLTVAQQRALVAEGDTLVTAAAGSGKTRVLTGRIVRAVLEQHVPLSAIVAVTFTEKAAQEIRERVASDLIAAGAVDQVGHLEHAAIGTIHGLCARLLRRYGTRIGMDPGFRVVDQAAAGWIRRTAIAESIAASELADPGVVSLRARWGSARLIEIITSGVAAQRSRCDGRISWPHDGVPTCYHGDIDLVARLVDDAVSRYRAALQRAGGTDFDGLEQAALELLRDEDVLVDVRSTIQRVLVDEFQDTNATQCELIDALGSGCTFAVGDEWQSIYRFRGADVDVFRGRADRVRESVIGMHHNFRSAPAVIDVVNTVFAQAFGDRYAPVIAGRDLERQHQVSSPACEVRVVVPETASDGRVPEARSVANRISQLIAAGVVPGNIAILLATQTHAVTFERALEDVGVQSVRAASRGFHAQRHVRDLLTMLSWVRDRYDDRAALGVLASPLIGMTPRDLVALRRSSRERGESLYESLASHRDHAAAAMALRVHAQLEHRVRHDDIVQIVHAAVYETGFASCVLGSRDGRRGLANARKLIELANAAHGAGITTLDSFLAVVSAEDSQASEGEAAVSDESGGAVHIMTVHASKGLEFDHVFIGDLTNRGRQTHARLAVDRDGAAAIELFDHDAMEPVVVDRLTRLRQLERDRDVQEKRRLMYVAMTRAREHLYLSGTCRRNASGALALTGMLEWVLPAITPDGCSAESPWARGDVSYEIVTASPQPERALPRVDAPVKPMGSLVSFAQSAAPVDTLLPDAPAGDELRRLDRGERLHAAIATYIRTGSAPADASVANAVESLCSSSIMGELRAASPDVEVPWFMQTESGEQARGRIDALARLHDGGWWIIDWKSQLPASAEQAWDQHADQLNRYIAVARAAGAASIRVTLASIAAPNHVHDWQLASQMPARQMDTAR